MYSVSILTICGFLFSSSNSFTAFSKSSIVSKLTKGVPLGNSSTLINSTDSELLVMASISDNTSAENLVTSDADAFSKFETCKGSATGLNKSADCTYFYYPVVLYLLCNITYHRVNFILSFLKAEIQLDVYAII